MLTCLKCFKLWVFSEADLAVDSKGLHFICAQCGRHNKLINIGGPKGPLDLVQPDISPAEPEREWHGSKSRSFG